MKYLPKTQGPKKLYNFDINMTQACTLRCTYCIQDFNKQKFEKLSPELTKKMIEKFDFLLNSVEFNKHYDGIRISFWGGEPTTNLEGVKEFVEYYRHNPRVCFFMYSNGYKYNHVFDYLETFKYIPNVGSEPKFLTQISYDGMASHDSDRLNLQGKGSAQQVKETVFELAKRNIPFIVHPTIAAKNFDKIAINYFEFKRMSDVLGIELNYNPTIDYMSKYDFTREQLESLTNTLKEEFLKIRDAEVEFFKRKGYFNFGWMNPNRSICTAGDGYSGIELDGKMYACHGVFSEEYKPNNVLNDINFENVKFTETLIKSSQDHRKILSENMPKACQECFTHYCLKCNSTKFGISNKETYAERWTDYSCQPGLCHMFKFIGKYRIALMKYIQAS